MTRLLTLLWVFMALFAATPALAQQPSCANPRDAADSLFNDNPKLGKTCLDLPEGANGERINVHLRQVLDARGLWVPVPSLPLDPDYTNEEGLAEIQLMPDEAPWLVVARGKDGQWRYTRETLNQVPGLYSKTFSPLSQWFQEQLPPVFYQSLLGIQYWQVLYAGMLVLIAWLIGRLVSFLLRNQVIRGIETLGLELDDKSWAKTAVPISFVAISAVMLWGISDLALEVQLSNVLHRIGWIAVAVSSVFAASRFLDVATDIANSWADETDSKLDDQLIPLLRQAARLLLWVVGLLFVLSQTGVDIWKLLAGVSVGSLAFALAAQDSAANLFGAANIFIDKPFQIGDWVAIGDVEGVVEEVGFRSVRVRTFYGSVVTIPNSKITTSNVDNYGLRTRRRHKLTLGLTYDTPPDKLQAYAEGVRAILAAHPLVQRTYEVHVNSLGSSSIDILVYYHFVCETWTEELEAKAANILEFLRLAERLEVSFAFPSQSLYLESTPDKPLPPHPPRSIDELQDVIDAFGPGGKLAQVEGPIFPKSWSVRARDQHDKPLPEPKPEA